MSYILDALKRADAQRTHGGVPGLHTRQLANPDLPATARTGRYLWPAVAALALGASATLWWLWPLSGSELQLAAVPFATMKAPVNTGQVQPQAMVTAKPAVAATSARTTIKPTTPIPGTPASVSQAESATVPLLSELPEDLRRQIPALVITGAVYSANPAQRLLLVNNQVLTQGSLAAPELILEEIRAKSSVFNFRGTRFRLAH